ncbi:MAG: hypothetical protein DHS20C14_17150 [Phycisphaeraceae bacterium]|nr:MAG: hypothetical protein DHS20C14_17150 [Phycisphaeraceae bacterium]
MPFDLAAVNWLAVPVAALAAFMVGGIVYGAVFGTAWVRLHGYEGKTELLDAMKKHQGRTFAIMFAAYLIMAVVLAAVLHADPASTWVTGVVAGAILWLGVGLPETTIQNAAHHKPIAAGAIDLAHQLAYLCVAGAILGAWH